MRVHTLSVFFIILALCFIVAVATEVFIDDYVNPHSLFVYLFMGAAISSLILFIIDIKLPAPS